jgi:hypothetical protein
LSGNYARGPIIAPKDYGRALNLEYLSSGMGVHEGSRYPWEADQMVSLWFNPSKLLSNFTEISSLFIQSILKLQEM